jgi:hypothetical protein
VTQEKALRSTGALTIDSESSRRLSSMTAILDSEPLGYRRRSAVRSVIPPSPEEQRSMQLYRKHGLPGVIEELKRVNCRASPVLMRRLGNRAGRHTRPRVTQETALTVD